MYFVVGPRARRVKPMDEARRRYLDSDAMYEAITYFMGS
jgi:hypothetical protein